MVTDIYLSIKKSFYTLPYFTLILLKSPISDTKYRNNQEFCKEKSKQIVKDAGAFMKYFPAGDGVVVLFSEPRLNYLSGKSDEIYPIKRLHVYVGVTDNGHIS